MVVANASKPATIREGAARAGVSTATVSRALRGGASVDPATRKRVEKAARDLRYRPSGVARSLKLRATQTLGLIVTDIQNPYFPQIVRAVEDVARVRDYSVILADGRRDADREIQSLELLAERQVDGLLIASSALTERHHRWIKERPCPVVIINSSSAAVDVPAVLSDNDAGGRLVAAHLLELGHRKIAYIGAAESDNVAVNERLEGMRSLLDEDERATEPLRTVFGTAGVDGGERSAREALEQAPEVTALACYNDLTAVGALRGVRSAGLRVPEDVTVVGFDDIELAPYVEPSLTTVRQATDEMGRWAVNKLLDLVVAPVEDDEAVEAAVDADRAMPERIPVELIVRRSSGPPPLHR
jgi:DNA-binding LacI/PurR family transcriptional regulator